MFRSVLCYTCVAVTEKDSCVDCILYTMSLLGIRPRFFDVIFYCGRRPLVAIMYYRPVLIVVESRETRRCRACVIAIEPYTLVGRQSLRKGRERSDDVTLRLKLIGLTWMQRHMIPQASDSLSYANIVSSNQHPRSGLGINKSIDSVAEGRGTRGRDRDPTWSTLHHVWSRVTESRIESRCRAPSRSGGLACHGVVARRVWARVRDANGRSSCVTFRTFRYLGVEIPRDYTFGTF